MSNEGMEGEMPSAPEPESLPAEAPDSSPPHSSSPAPDRHRMGGKNFKSKKVRPWLHFDTSNSNDSFVLSCITTLFIKLNYYEPKNTFNSLFVLYNMYTSQTHYIYGKPNTRWSYFKLFLSNSFIQQHFVSEWVGEKQQECGARTPEPAPERPLRISSDPEVLATQLNALPGMACSPQVYSTPKHYVRFSSPFLANRSPTTPGVPTGRRRSRELPETPPTTGSCKKVWNTD